VGVEVEVDRDLREIDFGLCEGMTFGEMQRRFPQAAGCWGAMPEDFAFPEGERLGDFVDRVRRAADRLVTEPSDVVLAISHGGVIRTMICHLLGLPVRDCWLFEVRPASLTTIEMMDGKAVLAGLSNSCTAQE
jgi:broad specificity phosphatase PhoE